MYTWTGQTKTELLTNCKKATFTVNYLY